MKNNKKVILFELDEAAKFTEGISGWVSRSGRFYGKDENAARYEGCTHVKCKSCDAVIEKHKSLCNDCTYKRKQELYKKKEKKEWDGILPLYSEYLHEYLYGSDLNEAIDEHGEEKLMLLICKEVTLSHVNEDIFEHDLPEDVEFDDISTKGLLDAMAKLNVEIDKIGAIGYEPSKFAATISYN